MTKQDLYNLLLDQYLTLNGSKDALITAAQTAEQAEQILDAWRQANLNQLTMANKILGQDTQAIEDLARQVDTATQTVKGALDDLSQQIGNLGVFASAVTAIQTAVSLGTSLVALV